MGRISAAMGAGVIWVKATAKYPGLACCVSSVHRGATVAKYKYKNKNKNALKKGARQRRGHMLKGATRTTRRLITVYSLPLYLSTCLHELLF